MAIGGTFLSNVYQFLSIHVFQCVNKTDSNITCASEELQREFYKANQIGCRWINYNYDPTNETDPRKGYIEDNVYFPTKWDQKMHSDVYIMNS